MDQQGPVENNIPGKRKQHWFRKILIALLFVITTVYFSLFFGLNYFGEKFLRNYLQEKILRSSQGVYRVDFRNLDINILTGRVRIDSFELIPDSNRYNQLKIKGGVNKALYEVMFRTLTLDRFYFWQIYATHRINLRKLILKDPVIRIAGFPDTIRSQRNRWRVVYEDIYPAISSVFNDFHIDSVKVLNGHFLSSFRPSTLKATSGEYEFSATLRDVSVNPFSYYNHDRVFYSRDVELVIHHVEFALADSLYFLKAEELGFSLTRSHLFGKKVSLVPNVRAKRLKSVRKGDFYQLDVPSFYIQGVDLYQALMDKKVEVGRVNLSAVKFKIFRNPLNETHSGINRPGNKIRLNDLYSVISKNLHFIAIDTLKIEGASLEFFTGLNQPNPELRISRVDITLDHFRLDSLAKQNRNRIFYSRDLELNIDDLNLKLRDGIHNINASDLYLSTKNSLLRIGPTIIFPDKARNLAGITDRRNTIYLLVSGLTFNGIDLKKTFNRRVLTFDMLTIDEPDLRYTRYRVPKNPDPRFKKPVDFFEEENEDFVYGLLKKYLWSVNANQILVSKGNMKYSMGQDNVEIPVASSGFNLSMYDFVIDSVHGMNKQGYFYSRDFDLNLWSTSLASPDSLSNFRADSVHIVTRDSVITVYQVQFFKSPRPVIFNASSLKQQTFSIGFSLWKLSLSGLNHRKLFLEKILRAQEIIIDDPEVVLKSQSVVHPIGPGDESSIMGGGDFIRTYEIGNCVIRKGDFSYDGQEDRKSTTFSLNDVDFTIKNAFVHIPGKGMNDGKIRFDSLRLSVLPIKAVISDSAYMLEVQSLRFHSYPARILAEGITVTPLKEGSPERKVHLFIPRIDLAGFYFDRAIFEKKWLIDEVFVEKPTLSVIGPGKKAQTGERKQDLPFGTFKLPGIIDSAAIKKLLVNGAEVSVSIRMPDTMRDYRIKDLIVAVDRFRVDKETVTKSGNGPLFFSDKITLSAPGMSFRTSDSLYTIAFSKIRLSTNPAQILIDSVAMIPRYDKSEFARRRGYQTDRMEIRLARIGLERINFQELLQDKVLHANLVNLDGFLFNSYRDKRIPFPAWQQRALPQQMIRKIRVPVIFDTIQLNGGTAVYEEQTGDYPGRLFFSEMNGFMTGFSTLQGPGPDMMITGSGRFMGTGKVEARIRFFRDHPRDSFLFSANLGSFDLPEINPMLSRLEPVMISRGHAPETRIWYIRANDSIATGLLTFKYGDLGVKLIQVKAGVWDKMEQSLLTELLNLIIPGSNPREGEPIRQGIIWYERDRTRGVFNFIWKSVLSGLKSGAGLNNKEQKAILKSQRKKKT